MVVAKFHERLRELRNEKGLTQAQLAGKLGVAPSCIGGWEQGAREPFMKNIIALCEFFDCSADYLIRLKDS